MSALVSNAVLEAQQLTKRYGALVACDQVSLSLLPGEIHALIGPNGAGKSTLIHLLSGSVAADSGRLALQGHDVTRASVHQRVAAGLSRSYQITNIFKQLSVFENLLLAMQACSGSSFSFWRARAQDTILREARSIVFLPERRRAKPARCLRAGGSSAGSRRRLCGWSSKVLASRSGCFADHHAV